jgi:replicative DNA helicase
MKNNTQSHNGDHNHAEENCFSVAVIAQQMIEDVEHLYRRTIIRNAECSGRASEDSLWAKLGMPSKGELIVVATRSNQLSEAFRLEIAQHVGCTLGQSVVMVSANDTVLRFTRKLLNKMSGIPAESSIYDGQLGEQEYQNLTSALVALSKSQIFMNQNRMIVLDGLRAVVKKHQQDVGEIGMVVVDYVQQIMGSHARLEEPRTSLAKLKALAVELIIPIVALYQLDQTVENQPSTLTQYELREIEELVLVTDRILLLSGTAENPVLKPPKIPS